jgi:hypothetical protein
VLEGSVEHPCPPGRTRCAYGVAPAAGHPPARRRSGRARRRVFEPGRHLVGPGEAPGGEAYVSVNLNTPEFPDVSTARRTLDAGTKKGSVLADDGLYCLVYVDNGPPWLQFSSQSAQAGAPDPAPKTYECDRSTPVLRKVIANVKW